MYGYEQLLLHLIGDYWTQTQWMANTKVKSWYAAIKHATVYSLLFFIIGSWQAVLVIWSTHAIIDRFSLAKRGIWLKNWYGNGEWSDLGPTGNPSFKSPSWKECEKNFGSASSVPSWISFPVYVACDNTLHLVINYFALKYL